MGITEKLQALFSSAAVELSAATKEPEAAPEATPEVAVNLATATLEDGQQIETTAEAFAPGADVFVTNDQGEQIPLPDATYTLEDGTKFVVEGGVIQEAPEAVEAEAETKPEELAAEVVTREDVRAMIQEAVTTLAKEIGPMLEANQEAITQLSAQPAAKVQRVKAEKVQLSRAELASMPLAERVQTMINQYS